MGNDEGLTSYSLYSGYAHMAAGLCCGLSCLAAGGTIGLIGEVGVQAFGLKACNGKRAWLTGDGNDGDDNGMSDSLMVEQANKLYVGLLIAHLQRSDCTVRIDCCFDLKSAFLRLRK